MAAASISERSRPLLRTLLLLALAMVGLLAMGPARAASDVFVLQDGTPLVSKPGVGGKILRWVDAGFPLTVVGRDGEWLKVSSSSLKSGRVTVWVPAARVGSHLPGMFDTAYSQRGPSSSPEGGELFLEVVGTQENRVHVRCRIVQPGRDDFIDVIEETPLRLDVGGPAADCTVRNLGPIGTIDAVLRTAAGELIASASTSTAHGTVRVSTSGPWGSGAGFVLPTRFIVLENMTKFPFPPGNPVPPLGNPMAALGNPVPALGNPVPPFQRSPVSTP